MTRLSPRDHLNAQHQMRQQQFLAELFATHVQDGQLSGSTCTWTEHRDGPKHGTFTSTVEWRHGSDLSLTTEPGGTLLRPLPSRGPVIAQVRGITEFNMAHAQGRRLFQFGYQNPGLWNTLHSLPEQTLLRLVLLRLQADPERQIHDPRPSFTLSVVLTSEGRAALRNLRMQILASPEMDHIDIKQSKYDSASQRWLAVQASALPLQLIPEALTALQPPAPLGAGMSGTYHDLLDLLRDIRDRDRQHRLSVALYQPLGSVLSLTPSGSLNHREPEPQEHEEHRALQQTLTDFTLGLPAPAWIVQTPQGTAELRTHDTLPVGLHPELTLLLGRLTQGWLDGNETGLHWTQAQPDMTFWCKPIDQRTVACQLDKRGLDEPYTGLLDLMQTIPVLTAVNRTYLQTDLTSR